MRLRVCAVVMLVLASAAPATAKEGFRVTQVDRYGGDADGDGRLDPDTTHLPRDLGEHPLRVTVDGPCDGARWLVDGKPRRVLLDGRCSGTIDVRGETRHGVTLERKGKSETRSINVWDRLVVVVGDSVAAGEGNVAAVPDPPWADRRCHRSTAAAGFEAAKRVAQAGRAQGREFALTVVSMACSGATTHEGLLGPYGGQEPGTDDALLEPQIDRLARLDAANDVSAVVVSIGANDVYFGPLVRACALRESCQSKSAKLGEAPRAGISNQVNDALQQLPDSYAELAGRLKQIVAPRKVLITEYFDPTRNDAGQLCRGGIGLDPGEWKFAANSVLRPLNDTIAAAAERHGWRLVDQTSADYRQHGYCARDRWVVRITESLLSGRGSPIAKALVGTLHPNVTGQLAISARIAPVLARTLWPKGTPAVAPPAIATHSRVLAADSESDWWHPQLWWLLVALALAIGWRPLLDFLWRILQILGRIGYWLIWRPLWLLRRSERADPMAETGPGMQLQSERAWEIGLRVAVVLLVLASLFAGLAIEAFRLLSAHLPSSGFEYVRAYGLTLELGDRVLWLAIAAACLLAALRTSPEGWPTRATRRLLAILVVIGMAATVLWLQDFSSAQELELLLGLLILVQCGHYLVDRALEGSGGKLVRDWRWVWKKLRHGNWLKRLWRVIPSALCLLAIYAAATADRGLDRVGLIGLPVLAAALAIVTPPGLGGGAASRKSMALRAPRDLLALTSFLVILVLEFRTEPALVLTGVAAALLALGCVYVATLSGRRFAPFGVALVASVLAFAAIESAFDDLRAPKGEGVAAFADSGELVCGVLLGKRDGRFAVAPIAIDDEGDVRGEGSPRLVDVADGGPGPTDRMPIPRALRQATRELAARTPGAPRAVLSDRSCPWPPRRPPARGKGTRPALAFGDGGRALAEHYQPRFVQDRDDGFWPIQVATTFSLEGRRGAVCLARAGRGCLRLARAGDLPWLGSAFDTIELPARMDRDDMQMITERALGTRDPHATSAVYFLATPPGRGFASAAIQYWTYFTYDYVPLVDDVPLIDTIEGGSHQGDWEYVGVVLSRHGEPRYFWMSRHTPSVEGRPFAWGEEHLPPGLETPAVWTAQGSHAGYEQCGVAVRDQGPAGLLDEGVVCDPARQVAFAPETTPLIDLARTPWACFAGGFGRDQGGILEKRTRALHLIENAPRGPLWQQNFDHVTAQPCKDTDYDGPRTGFTEEVLDASMAKTLRAGAGRLERWFDDCDDWEKAPTRGALLVVCEPRELRRFFADGLDAIPADGPWIGDGPAARRATTLPAVQRSVRPGALRTWRIGGSIQHATVFAARREGGSQTIGARFVNVTLKRGQILRVDERNRRGWRLVDTAAEGDPPVADAPVDVVSSK